MLQALESESRLPGKVQISIGGGKPTARVERLRQAILSIEPKWDISRARILTRVMKETEGELSVTRRAKAFAAMIREMPLNICAEEMFAGYLGATRDSLPLRAEAGPVNESWFRRAATAKKSDGKKSLRPGYSLSRGASVCDEDLKEIVEEILPYWKAQGRWERTSSGRNWDELMPPAMANLLFAAPAADPTTDAGIASTASKMGAHTGHLVLDNNKVLKKGYLGVKKEAEDRLSRLDFADPDELKKVPFLKGVITAMQAAAELGARFAAKARELAGGEQDPESRAELLAIAEVCDQVPANPAQTFRQGLQAIWFTYLLANWETLEGNGISVGRCDQYLYPYYEADVREGRLTHKQAQELIDCFMLKLQETDKPVKHLSVGGYKPDGNDATNELSYMFIEGMMHARMADPNLGVMIHTKSPDALLLKGCQLAAMGTGQPMFENCDVIVPALVARDTDGRKVTLQDARNATCIGCQEAFFVGQDGNWQYTFVNVPMAMEFALNNGVTRVYRRRMGLETGDARRFQSFQEVQEAYRKQLAWIIQSAAAGDRIREINMAELHPTLFQSALTEDCIETGICREAGGAHYNSGPGLFGVGLPDVADSLTAIRKVVFEDKKATLSELCDALDKDFAGHDALRQMLREAPKYGNDDDYADEQMSWVMHEWATEVMKQKNTRGGRFVPTSMALGFEVPYGMVLGALPSGRRAGVALSNGSSPCDGVEMNGPTAVIKSLGKVNNLEMSNGNILNMRIAPAVFEDGNGIKRMADLLRTMVDQKVMHIQFNVISSDTLRKAQAEPEKYRDLVVRVAGYSAFFTRLGKELQNEIIGRTEHGL